MSYVLWLLAVFAFMFLDGVFFLLAVKKASRQGTFWQGFTPGSGFYFWLFPKDLKRWP